MLSIGTDNGLRSSVPFAGPSASRAAALRRLPATSFIEFTIGDITRETTDAIVNPVGPGLVDLAVRQAAGPEMLDACHAVTTIPTNPAYPSLNLAQAALLVLYQLFQRAGGQQQAYRPPRRQAPAASSQLLEDLFADAERALEAIEFLKQRPRASTLRSLRVALYGARLDVRQASLLRAVFIEIRKFLRRKGVLDDIGPVGARPSADLTGRNASGTLAEDL